MFRSTLCLALIAATAVAAPHVANDPEPRDGLETLTLTEVWHRGHDDDDVIFGAVRTVEIGPDGDLYVLDTQLSQAFVFAPDGELLRELSREGEGPGEVRRPEDLVFFDDGSLGLAQYLAGRIVRIERDGTPRATVMPPGEEGTGGGMASIRRVRNRAGTFVINGVRMRPDDEGGMVRTQYLVRCEEDATPVVEYLARSTPSNLMRDGWIEKNNYFPSHERWDIDAAGDVVCAPERNEYLIAVYGPDGVLKRTFGREYEPRPRTEQEKDEIRESLVVIRDGQRIEVEVEVEDFAAAISEVRAMPGGETWVLPARPKSARRPGVMMTWDVFDADGVFVREVAVACEGDPEEDRLFFVAGDRAVLVRGAVQARRNAFGGSRVDEKDVAVHDLKMFAFD